MSSSTWGVISLRSRRRKGLGVGDREEGKKERGRGRLL